MLAACECAIVMRMTNDESSEPKATTARIIIATRSLNGNPRGTVELISATKHGHTPLIAVKPPTTLAAGEALVTDGWVLGSRNFVVVGEHTKPMKIPGTWYVVRVTKAKA
jgi:hypothetical protein